MNTKKFIAILLAAIVLTFIGCANKSADVSQNTSKEEMQGQIDKNISQLLQSSTTDKALEVKSGFVPQNNSDTADMVVGTWRFQHPLEGTPLQCVSEQVFQSNGAYSGMTQCGPYAVQRTGEWSLPDNNTIRVSLNDGKLVRWDSWKFRMLDNNRMALGDGRIVAFRVN
jgi:hypothetical protein